MKKLFAFFLVAFIFCNFVTATEYFNADEYSKITTVQEKESYLISHSDANDDLALQKLFWAICDFVYDMGENYAKALPSRMNIAMMYTAMQVRNRFEVIGIDHIITVTAEIRANERFPDDAKKILDYIETVIFKTNVYLMDN